MSNEEEEGNSTAHKRRNVGDQTLAECVLSCSAPCTTSAVRSQHASVLIHYKFVAITHIRRGDFSVCVWWNVRGFIRNHLLKSWMSVQNSHCDPLSSPLITQSHRAGMAGNIQHIIHTFTGARSLNIFMTCVFCNIISRFLCRIIIISTCRSSCQRPIWRLEGKILQVQWKAKAT